MYSMRIYQWGAVKAAWKAICQPPPVMSLIEAECGAGKSVMIANVARLFRRKHPQERVLVLGTTRDIVEQNFKAYSGYHLDGSIYCEALKRKDISGSVVFASYQSLVAFNGPLPFSLILVDEAHEFADSHRKLIARVKQYNPDVPVIGFTATPYRLINGKVLHHYQNGLDDSSLNAEAEFSQLIHQTDGKFLTDQGYLSPLVLPEANDGEDGKELDDVMGDFLYQVENRNAVLVFCANAAQKDRVAEFLPPGSWRYIDGKTGKEERRKHLADFKAGEYKFLLNLKCLTTGVDVPRIDVVAIFRSTSSVNTHKQMIGRGMRLAPGKEDCLLLDYAGNLDTLYANKNLYNLNIGKPKDAGNSDFKQIECPTCHHPQHVKLRDNPDGLEIDKHGYAALNGIRLKEKIVMHWRRRCEYVNEDSERCVFMWTGKLCHACEHENDIAARFCSHCKVELTAPDKKLSIGNSRQSFNVRMKKNDKTYRIEKFDNFFFKGGVTTKGKTYITFTIYQDDQKKTFWIMRHQSSGKYGSNLHTLLDFNPLDNPMTIARQLNQLDIRNIGVDDSRKFPFNLAHWNVTPRQAELEVA